MQRTLVLIRHAEAANPWGIADLHRPLTDIGRQQAKRLAGLLDHQGISFDTLYISAAQRTQETAEELRRTLQVTRHEVRDELYLPSRRSIIDITHELDDEACVGIVIHEPAVSDVGEYYAKAATGIHWGVSVATALILTWEGQWTDLQPRCADLHLLCGSE